MRRREFITLLGSAAATWPLAARAQQPTIPIVGYLGSTSIDTAANIDTLSAFRRGLAEMGYFEGRNVMLEFRWGEFHYDRLPALAADLARRQVAVIVAIGALPNVMAAKGATMTIPVVFGIGGDPVQLGLVASLNRPGGNLTGVTNLNTEVLPKRLELLHKLVPAAVKIALLVNPTNLAAEAQVRTVQAAARTLGLQIDVLNASSEREIDAAVASLAELRSSGLVIAGDGVFVNRSEQLAALALRHATPAIFQYHEFAAAGGMMSYGTSLAEISRLVGVYAGRVIKGEKPADLPVVQPTKFELVINLKTTKALGIEVPPTLLALADEVIE
jgi:putative tryptophan/tyrosine transport system substrate-binding protein